MTASLAKVDQNIMLFQGTVLQNITLFDATVALASVRQAAEDAQIADEINQRVGGYSSMVDEGGTNFSGGQAQRLEIARSIARNPSILLLDEATSALDAESEHVVQAALEALMRDRTTIIIAHRLATVMAADRIVVMDHGRIVAQGTHAELVRDNTLYARLAALQFTDGSAAPTDNEET